MDDIAILINNTDGVLTIAKIYSNSKFSGLFHEKCSLTQGAHAPPTTFSSILVRFEVFEVI